MLDGTTSVPIRRRYSMQIAIVLLAGLATAYAARAQSWRRMLTASDILIGLVGGATGLSMTYFLTGTSSQLGLALLLGCGLVLGLQSCQRPAL
jgi:hypothetical protein